MPLRVSNSVEKNVVLEPLNPKVIPANTPIEVLTDIINHRQEYAGRYIQNVGAGDCYYAFGHKVDSTNFNGILSKPGSVDANGLGSGQQLDASNNPQAVWVYSVAGTTIAITLFKRNDNAQGQGGIL